MRKLAVVLALLAVPASAGDLLERARLAGVRRELGKLPVYLASLTPAHYFAPAPVLFQIVPLGGGGGGGGTIAPGSTTFAACNANAIWYVDGSKVLQCDGPTYDNSGAGNGVFTFAKTPSGGSATSNFVNFTGTTPTTLTAEGRAMYLGITGAGSSAQALYALRTDLLAGFTGTGVANAAVAGFNTTATTNSTPYSFVGNYGVFGSSVSNPGAQGWNIGVGGQGVNNGTTGRAVGGFFGAVATGSGVNIGVVGAALNGTTANVGGVFHLTASVPSLVSTGILVDNGTQAAPITIFRDNGSSVPTTGASATVVVQDGANLQYGLGVLTNATMTAESQAQVKSVVSSYTWSNAQVVALGASTTGDITVATLPAKTQVRNAYVVITGAAAGPATVTVSCGDAIGGTPFVNYIIASDAKAAANTVYGDAAAERGTSMDVEFYNLPAYAATTLVTCHFISTGANLDTVTGSTGRVILETILLP